MYLLGYIKILYLDTTCGGEKKLSPQSSSTPNRNDKPSSKCCPFFSSTNTDDVQYSPRMLTFALLVSVALLYFSLALLEKLMVAASDAGSGEKGGYKLCCLRRSCNAPMLIGPRYSTEKSAA